MTSKITAILAAALVLASAGVASAQTKRHVPGQWYAPYATPTWIQEICATVTQTTPCLTPMAGRGDQPPRSGWRFVT